MFKKWIKHITKGTTYFGIEIVEYNYKEQYSLLKIKQKKGELESVLETTTQKIEEIIACIDKRTSVFLTLNTSKVLKKQIAHENEVSDELLVIKAFPNLDLNNFYYQILKGKKESVVAITKKEYLDSYILQLQKKGVQVYSIALGVASLKSVSSFLQGTIYGFDFRITLKEGLYEGYSLSEPNKNEKYDINGLIVGNKYLLSFSHILAHLMDIKPSSNFMDLNRSLNEDLMNSKVFHFMLNTSLAFCLLLLLVNFLLFSHYNSVNESLKNNLNSNALEESSLLHLKKRVQEKEEKLKLLANSKNSWTTLYFDELAKTVPHSIWLSNMAYQPLIAPVRENKLIQKSTKTLKVSGVTTDKEAFTLWLDKLESHKWIKTLEIVHYEYISSSSTNFTFNIKLNEAR